MNPTPATLRLCAHWTFLSISSTLYPPQPRTAKRTTHCYRAVSNTLSQGSHGLYTNGNSHYFGNSDADATFEQTLNSSISKLNTPSSSYLPDVPSIFRNVAYETVSSAPWDGTFSVTNSEVSIASNTPVFWSIYSPDAGGLDPAFEPFSGMAGVAVKGAVAGVRFAASKSLSSSVGELRALGLKDAHHIVQDAAVRNLPGYSTNAARGVQLAGPANARGTAHYLATQVQRQAGGGTLGAELRIGYKSLRRAGYTPWDARQLTNEAGAYFKSIGADASTITRIPGNR
jgi:hypothetical protein